MEQKTKKRGDWHIKKRERRYSNPWIKVDHHEVIDPSGKDGIYGVVHFQNLAIAVIPLDEQMNTRLVGQYRFPLDRFSWEIPEGGGPLGTDPLQNALRELKEETGLSASLLKPFLKMDLSNSVTDEQSISYLALDLKEGKSEEESTENIYLQKIPIEEVFAMAMEGKIRDALSVASLLKLQIIFLENNLQTYDQIVKHFTLAS